MPSAITTMFYVILLTLSSDFVLGESFEPLEFLSKKTRAHYIYGTKARQHTASQTRTDLHTDIN